MPNIICDAHQAATTPALLDRRTNEAVYSKHKDEIEGKAIALARAMKVTGTKIDAAFEVENPSQKLVENLNGLCDSQQRAQEVEMNLNWITRFKAPKGQSILTDKLCLEGIAKAQEALDDLLVCAKCLKAVTG